MAYDRPSPKLLSFLAKHYRLTDSVPQVGSGWSSRFVLGSWLPSSGRLLGLVLVRLVPGLSTTILRKLLLLYAIPLILLYLRCVRYLCVTLTTWMVG